MKCSFENCMLSKINSADLHHYYSHWFIQCPQTDNNILLKMSSLLHVFKKLNLINTEQTKIWNAIYVYVQEASFFNCGNCWRHLIREIIQLDWHGREAQELSRKT